MRLTMMFKHLFGNNLKVLKYYCDRGNVNGLIFQLFETMRKTRKENRSTEKVISYIVHLVSRENNKKMKNFIQYTFGFCR